MKICSKCRESKNEEEYWIRNNRKSGLNSECKACASLRRKSKNAENKIKHKEYLKNNPEKEKEYRKRYQENHKETINEYHREWYKKNKEKISLQRKKYRERVNKWNKEYSKRKYVKERALIYGEFFRAKKSGIIKIPNFCTKCLEKKKIEAHHTDYTNPIIVVWLCKKCHVEEHKKKE